MPNLFWRLYKAYQRVGSKSGLRHSHLARGQDTLCISWGGLAVWVTGPSARCGWPAGGCVAAHSAGPTPFLRKAVPPIRSLTMHLPASPSWMPTPGTGKSGVGDFANRLRLTSTSLPAICNTVRLLPGNVRDGGGAWVNAAGLTSAASSGGTASGCQTLCKRRIAAHSAGPTPFLRKAVPPIRSLTMHLPASPSWMPTPGTGKSGVGDFANRLRLTSTSLPAICNTVRLLPGNVRDGGGAWVNAAGLTSAASSGGTASGCQTLLVAQRLGARPSANMFDAIALTPICCLALR